MRKYARNFVHNYFANLLAKAGITIDGTNPWDIRVTDPRLYDALLTGGSLAFGEGYMNGWWECDALDQFFYKLLQVDVDSAFLKKVPEYFMKKIKPVLLNRQSRSRAFEVGEHHYNAGNDLFKMMLDSNMVYSCGYWKDAENLEEAQKAKLDLICRKLYLREGMRMLDIGCGWGSLSRYAAENYGVSVVGITVSEEQATLARERCKGLPVEIALMDYRDHQGSYDVIASVGMFEHVGYKNYVTFFDTAKRLLKEDGLFLLHTIGANETVYACDPWFDKYIFPNGMLPSVKQIGGAIEKRFFLEDWQNFGVDYDTTLMCWYKNFEAGWNAVKDKYSERFYRMWRYYLLSCAGGFRSRQMQLWQLVLSPTRRMGRYDSIR